MDGTSLVACLAARGHFDGSKASLGDGICEQKLVVGGLSGIGFVQLAFML